jgi:hypothetical protein
MDAFGKYTLIYGISLPQFLPIKSQAEGQTPKPWKARGLRKIFAFPSRVETSRV